MWNPLFRKSDYLNLKNLFIICIFIPRLLQEDQIIDKGIEIPLSIFSTAPPLT